VRDDPKSPGKALAPGAKSKSLVVQTTRALDPRRKKDIVGELVGAFESETAEVFLRTAPVREHMVLYVFLAMMVVAFGLSAVTHVDRVVTGVGRIVSLAPQLYISAYDNAIVREVLVKPGQRVKKGQALAKLDPTFTQADLTAMLDHRDSDVAQIARDEAEIARLPYRYSPAKHYEVLQGQLFEKRKAAYNAEIADLDGKIHSAEALVAQFRSDVHEYTSRLKLAQDVENSYIPLVDKGYISQLQLTQATDARTEMQRLLADAKEQLASNEQLLAAAVATKQAYIEQWNTSIASDLVSMRKDLDQTVQQIEKDQRLQDLTELQSPVDATITKIGKLSPGSIAPGGGTTAVTVGTDPLFTLMPTDSELVAQLDIQSMDAAFVRVGDSVTIKLDDYSFTLHGTSHGTIQSISENSFTLDDNSQPAAPYFRALAKIDRMSLYNVPKDMRLVPGETLTGDILVGDHTVLEYFTENLMRTGAESMREP
jgi:hemolysin D